MSPSFSIHFDVKHTLDQSPSRGSSWTIDVFIPKHYQIEKVSFCHYHALLSEPLFVTKNPTNIRRSNGSTEKCFRYKGYQHPKSDSKYSNVVIQLFSSCGRYAESSHSVAPEKAGKRHGKIPSFSFEKSYPWDKRLIVASLTNNQTYGIELELSDSNGMGRQSVANAIERRTASSVKVVDHYRNSHKPSSRWKLVHDGSIECNRSTPNCSKFELVSPILRGEEGLTACHNILESLNRSKSVDIAVNKSMGFHVHVSVKGFTLGMLKNLCKNFVEHEDVMDAFMPPSRHDSAYCQSNKKSIRNYSGTIAKKCVYRHRAIDACESPRELCALMNPKGRYYKLNLQNLVTGRQETVEFRQHSATASTKKVLAWARFCVLFVKNSASVPAPERDTGATEQFHALFNNIIRCDTLKQVYKGRMDESTLDFASLAISDHRRRACCHECTRGQACTSSRRH